MSSGISSGPVSAGAWVAIAKGTGAIDITAIPTGFKFLKLRLCVASTGNLVSMTFNGDATNTYTWSYNDGGAVHTERTSAIRIYAGGAAFILNTELDITNIATANKQVSGAVMLWLSAGGSSNSNTTMSGTWENATDEISRVTVTSGTPVYWALYGSALI